MSSGLETTLKHLSKTPNEASVGLLLGALESPENPIQAGALASLLKRKSLSGHREVLRRVEELDEPCKDIIREHPGRMSAALREAVLGSNPKMCENACRAILWFHEFDLMSALINAGEDETNPNADLAARTVLDLAEILYAELSGKRDYANRRDPQMIRQHVVSSLDLSFSRFRNHKRREMLEAFLILATRENGSLRKVLSNPRHPDYLPLVEILTQNQKPGILRLLLGFFDEPGASSTAINIIGHRTDERFLRFLFKKIGYEPSKNGAKNLRRIESIAWLSDLSILESMDDAAQHSAVQMVMASGLKTLGKFPAIEYLCTHGKRGGRRAAVIVLSEFSGGVSNQLLITALRDEDPQVQANSLGQLRHHGVPTAMSCLVDALDSPHEVVQQAARDSLEEFQFDRFLSMFETMEESERGRTAVLVHKVDPNCVDLLYMEMASQSRMRKMRAAAIAHTMGVARELEKPLLILLQDEDHMVRGQAAVALSGCPSVQVGTALAEALGDSSVSVQETAQEAFAQWQQIASKAFARDQEKRDQEKNDGGAA